jgi:hypothetical protein
MYRLHFPHFDLIFEVDSISFSFVNETSNNSSIKWIFSNNETIMRQIEKREHFHHIKSYMFDKVLIFFVKNFECVINNNIITCCAFRNVINILLDTGSNSSDNNSKEKRCETRNRIRSS